MTRKDSRFRTIGSGEPSAGMLINRDLPPFKLRALSFPIPRPRPLDPTRGDYMLGRTT